MSDRPQNILVMAGGTGGHIYPALAVASELETRGHRITWLGSEGGMEQELVSRESISLRLLPVTGVRGKGKLALLKAPFVLMQCVVKAMKIIRETQTDLVVGFGGFASGPGGLAAALLRKPLLIHEQNAIAGMTNRVLSRLAQVVCEAFQGTFKSSSKVHTTGNPIRKVLTNLASNVEHQTDGKVNLLIVGGSRGAKVFNERLPVHLKELIDNEKINVWHQTGKGNFDEVNQLYRDVTSIEVTVSEFIHDMDKAYLWADLVICRAGALTVSELAVVGLPAIFVPYPYAVDDHQTANAEYLVSNKAALLVPQDQFVSIGDKVEELISEPERLAQMSSAAKGCAVDNAAERITDLCESMIKSSQNE